MGMQLISTTTPKQINNGHVLQLCMQKQEGKGRLDRTLNQERERAGLADLKKSNMMR